MIKQLLAAGLFASLASALLGATTPAYAATFDPGRIIDDSVMTNSSSMTAAQIQTFLNSKVPSCDTNGTQPASDFGRPDLTHAQYAALKGWQAPPYTCLKDKVENGLTAAQIIYNVSQQYSINPQVFVVLIQKESSLVTDTWPLNWQYNSATGYGCPDSTPGVCDTSYRGLTNQVTWAARLFRNVINQSPTWYSPYIKGSNFIQWSPIASCGGSVVNVQNWSTAALYDYTPYQPNQAALNAGYGMGDGCSAYGNRNFFLFFNDWFGATNAPAYSWKLMGQYAFTDQTKTSPTSLNNLLPGQRVFLSISALNQGNQTWTSSGSNPVRIGTSNPLERSSVFYDPSWISSGRPANLKESSVPPGQVGTFEFWIKAPQVTQTTNYNEYFNPLAEGAAWMNNIGLFYGTTVQKPTYTWSMASQYAYTDSSKTTVANLNNLLPGQKVFIGFTAKNTGNQTWLNSGANAVMAGTANPLDRRSAFSIGSDWLSASRPVLLKEASVAPGQIGTFEFWMTVPASGVSGIYHERFSLIANNLTWMNDVGLSYYMNVAK